MIARSDPAFVQIQCLVRVTVNLLSHSDAIWYEDNEVDDNDGVFDQDKNDDKVEVDKEDKIGDFDNAEVKTMKLTTETRFKKKI